MKIKAKLGAYSSIVGQPVLLLGEGGRAEAQITLLHHGDMFRDRAKQIELLTVIVNAINGTQDRRPLNCRFRLQEAGQPYPRSSCNACAGNILTGLGNQCRMVKAEAAPEPENPYKDELLKIAAMVGEPEDPFAAWEVIENLQSTAMVSVEEVKVEGEPEVDPLKEAFCAGWITNAGHESGDYLTGCMEGDYRDWQKDPMGYFADAWKVARDVGTAAEEGTISTDVPYPPKTNEDVMNALGAATIKADKIDLDNSGATTQVEEPQKKPKTMKDVAAAFLDVMAAEREQDPLKKYTTFTPATDTEAAHPYTVGPRTMREVFEPAGLTDLSDMQAFLDAVEAGLIRVATRY